MKKGAKAPKNVDEYIAGCEPAAQEKLIRLRKTIKAAAPKAEELISYGMPGYKLDGLLVFFAAFNNHYSFFTGGKSAIVAFADQIEKYEVSASGIKIPYTENIPLKLVKDIVKFRLQENQARAAKKKK